MVEPTESEDLAELDRFCDAMIAIGDEIEQVAAGEWPVEDNPLRHAPHTAEAVINGEWEHAYSREQGAFPVAARRPRSTGRRSRASTRPTATATWSAPARRSRRLRDFSAP